MSQRKYSLDQSLYIVELKDQGGLSFREIARKMGGGLGTVHAAYHWAKEQLEIGSASIADADPEGLQLDGLKAKPEVGVKLDGPNKVVLSADGKSMITSVDQLVEYCEVDLTVWDVKDYEVTAWPGWAKHEEKDLTFVEGKSSGHVKMSGDIVTTQLVRVHAELVRKNPLAVLPELQAAPQFSIPQPDPPKFQTGEVYTAIFSVDWQVGYEKNHNGVYMTPFHDRRVLDLTLQLASIIQPDQLILGGDIVDLPEWSKGYRKKPGYYWTTQPTIFETHFWLSLFRETLPNVPIIYLEGNHEKRLPNSVIDYMPAMYQLTPADMTVPVVDLGFLLGLIGLGIDYRTGYPNNDIWLSPTLCITHGEISRKNPGDAAKAIAQGSQITNVYGHGHALELVGYVHRWGGGQEVLVEAASPGCSCRVDYVVPGHKKSQKWRQGVAEILYTPDGDHTVNLYPIRDGSLVYGGEVLRARPEIIEGLQDAYPTWQWTDPSKEWWE